MLPRPIRGVVGLLALTAGILSGARGIHATAHAQITNNSPHLLLAFQKTYGFNDYWAAGFGAAGAIVCGIVTAPTAEAAVVPCAIGTSL